MNRDIHIHISTPPRACFPGCSANFTIHVRRLTSFFLPAVEYLMARRDPNDFISLLMTDTGKGSVHFSTITNNMVTKTPERLPFYAGVSLAVRLPPRSGVSGSNGGGFYILMDLPGRGLIIP